MWTREVDIDGNRCSFTEEEIQNSKSHESLEKINIDISFLQEPHKELVSDGYHTFWELYKHRYALLLALCSQIQDNQENEPYFLILRSKKHYDNSEIEGWFIIQIETPKWQISYHLPNEYWDKASFIFERPKAAEWDGHTSDDVIERLLNLI